MQGMVPSWALLAVGFNLQQNSTWPKKKPIKTLAATSAPNHAPPHRGGGLGEIHF
jgi:hypothetical protein